MLLFLLILLKRRETTKRDTYGKEDEEDCPPHIHCGGRERTTRALKGTHASREDCEANEENGRFASPKGDSPWYPARTRSLVLGAAYRAARTWRLCRHVHSTRFQARCRACKRKICRIHREAKLGLMQIKPDACSTSFCVAMHHRRLAGNAGGRPEAASPISRPSSRNRRAMPIRLSRSMATAGCARGLPNRS